MRVILRNPHADDGRDFQYSLTVGREYEVLGLCIDSFRLLNDKDEPILYDTCCFEVSDAAEPEFWVSHDSEEGERYAHPAEWSRPGYFEDWHDGVPAVVACFWRDLERLYPWTAAERRTRRCT
ncbi:Uncharacterized protein OS=Planctomyces limnophilus (strain ATCC 43296 / DSM 3776 / IFAM 1008 / 290) GN=Plim_0788 PE=4 SV=1 [Tuwongella immobilis]|uniref:Uncharacterized protein n=1 Tax=Tuwongella immobilis TaxID=692036 RepID=A0A6C2YKZ5_9BACT|nr:Uncharacterized protein OS=Planctomyces limnophilus (strain ATCC 43296 / DSM 3776 / IFAM 1008 / 290) GN=Plim_0788 PE=4 SV=1 [Tuwongella immobilis]VTR99412.1 Uncharacterized protein OS=Planctomyces limnophilus (strain ATCC 43296 / DSM 3776 / IFAM 1008 / 290) GN=Plim_0788 PE=4 SV=1 [Tuwongella immobilis]